MNPKSQSNTLTKKKKLGAGAEQKGSTMSYFDGMVEYIPEALIATDNRHVVIGWNPAAERIYGWKAEEVLGKTLKEILQTEYQDTQRDHVVSKVMEAETWSGEVSQLRKDGKRIPIRSSVSVVKDKQGAPIGYIGINCDISEQKQTEETLSSSEVRFHFLFDSVPQGMVHQDANGRVIDANPAAQKILGLTLDQLQGRTSFDPRWKSIHEDGSEFPGETHPAMLALQTGKNVSDVIMGVYNPVTDEYRWLNINAIPRFHPGDKAPYEVYVTFEDITERIQAEKQIVQIKRLYATLSQVNQTIVRVKDRVDLYQSICDVAVQFGEFHLVWVGLLDEASGEVRPAAAVGQDINHWPFAAINIHTGQSQNELIVEAIRNSKVVTSEDIGNDERIKSQTELIQKYGYHSTAVIPFRLKGKTIGVVSLVSVIKGFFKSEDEIRLLDEMGLDISFALDTMETEADRKEAEASLSKSQNLLQDIIDHTPSLVYALDTTGCFILANQRLGTLFGLADRQVIGKTRADILPLEIANEHRKNDVQVINSRQASLFEEENQEEYGKHFYLTLKFPLIDADDKVYAVCGISTDITERKQVDERIQVQLQRLSALSEIDRAISSSMDLRLSLDILLTQVLSQLHVDAASVLLLNPASQTFEYFTGKGFRTLNIHQSRTRLGEGLAGRAGLERKLFHIPDLAELDSQFHRREFLKGEEFVEYFGVPLIAKGMLKGVLEIFHRSHLNPDLDWLNYLETLGGQAAIAIDNIQLFEGTQKSNLELIRAYDATIEGWSRAMDLRDKETEGHTLRVTELTVQLAIKLGVGQQEMTQLRRGALLHDIGKLGIPDNILFKPDKLTDFEWAIMRQHPSYAYKMLLPIAYLRPALDIPYCHHEKWDGTGYPRGLREEQIPLSARIFAIVDVWDALRSNRPYRASWTIEKTREHIIEGSGTHFDPQVVEAFLSLLDEFPDLR